MKAEQEVIIAGAGPTGMTLGAELLRLGIHPLIIDRQAAGENTSRACVVHARTLEVLEEIGATNELVSRGLIVPVFRVRDRSKVLATISFRELDTKYPFTLMCPQNRVEEILLARLQAYGGAVRRPSEVTRYQEYTGGVRVFSRTGDGEEATPGKWVVGCDGGRSVIRQQAGISFEGGAYEETFVLADVKMDWPLDREEVTLFYSEKGLMVVAPLPEAHYRIVATVAAAPERPSIDDVRRILAERGPVGARINVRELVWSSRFRLQHRVAGSLRRGRVLLAGDAAHVHSPAGGQGMNTGIQDAVSLAQALHHAIRSGDESALVEWEQRRLEVARSVVSLTDRMTRVATLSSPVLKTVRNTLVEWIGHVPFATQKAAEKLAELSY